MNEVPFSELLGCTLSRVIQRDAREIEFVTSDGAVYRQHHDQDCCEDVRVEEVVGDLSDLIGSPVLQAEEVSCENETPVGVALPNDCDDSFTWTFYKLATIKGSVTIRWFGSSNGYYSEAVSFRRIHDPQPPAL
jgi:hypothetical protein